MNVFISYSGANLELINKIAKSIGEDVHPLFWEKDKEPGEHDWGTIFGLIDKSEYVLVVITDSTVKRGIAVGQEVGYARKSGKKILPFLSKSVPGSETGFLKDITAVHLDEEHAEKSIQELNAAVKKIKIQRDLAILAEKVKIPVPAVPTNGDAGAGLLLIAGLAIIVILMAEKK
jgi:hypothetical protein